MKYAGRLTVPVILVMSIVTASLWQRLLSWPVSESGRLCRGDGNQGLGCAHSGQNFGSAFQWNNGSMFRTSRRASLMPSSPTVGDG